MSEKPPESTAKLALWLTFVAFLLIVLVFRDHLSEIHFGTEGVSAKMMNPQDTSSLSPEAKKDAEQQLTQRVSAVQEQASAAPEPAVAQQEPLQQAPAQDEQYQPQQQTQQTQFNEATYQQPSLPNIAGYWSSPNGLTYQINQYGNYVAVSELNGGMTEAVATGQIAAWSFTLPSYNLAGRSGMLSLQVSADQRQISGQYMDVLTGNTVPIQLSR